jgi:hypothetical protein
MDGSMMRGPFEWQMIGLGCDLVNGEVLEIVEGLKVILALRRWEIMLV